MTKDRLVEEATTPNAPKKGERRKRVPFGSHRARLGVNESKKDEDFVYRWFNAVQDRLERALEAGWQHVTRKEIAGVGDEDVGQRPDGLGMYVSKKVNDLLTVYLMKLPKEYWEEDQELKRKDADEIDESIFGGGANKVPKSYGLDVKYKR